MFVSPSRRVTLRGGRWKFLCIQFDILQSCACHNLCLIMLLSLYTGLVAAVDVQSIQFKYTCSVSVVTDPSIHPTNHPSIKQQWRRRSLWRVGMLPRSLPLSFSGVSHLIGRQMSAKEISPRALNTLRQLLGTGRLPHHPPSLPSISFCVHSIQLNADDSGS